MVCQYCFATLFQTSFLGFSFSGSLRSSCLGGMVAGMAIRTGRAIGTGRAVGTGKMTGSSPGIRSGAGLLKRGAGNALSKVLTAVVALPDRAVTQDLPRAKVVTQDLAKVVALPDQAKQVSQQGVQMNQTTNTYMLCCHFP